MQAYPEKIEANPAELKSAGEQQEIPMEGHSSDNWSTEGLIWGLAASYKAPLTPKEMGPQQWWVPKEVGRWPLPTDR
jgi:hypothetical protein